MCLVCAVQIVRYLAVYVCFVRMTRKTTSVVFLLAACCVLRGGQGKVSRPGRKAVFTTIQHRYDAITITMRQLVSRVGQKSEPQILYT